VISAYDDQNQWMTWKQRYDSAVSQFDGFSGQCDSIMNVSSLPLLSLYPSQSISFLVSPV